MGRLFLFHWFDFLTSFYFLLTLLFISFTEHHFDGFFFNKIPVWRKLGLREVFTTKMAVSSLDPKKVSFSDLPTELKGLNGFYAEIGFGIENILKLLRVDFSWRLTQKNQNTFLLRLH